MSGKNWLVAGAATLFIGLICLIVWMPIAPSPAPGVTVENAKRINAAMKTKDLEELMGSRGVVVDEFDVPAIVFVKGGDLLVTVKLGEDGFATSSGVSKVGDDAVAEWTELERSWAITLLRWWRGQNDHP